MTEERWPPTPIRYKSTGRLVKFERGYGYVGRSWPERDDHVKMLFKSAAEYEEFILCEAERIRSERDASAGNVEAAD